MLVWLRSSVKAMLLLMFIGVGSGPIFLAGISDPRAEVGGSLSPSGGGLGGLLAQFWQNTFFGAPLSGCAVYNMPMTPSVRDSYARTDPTINFGQPFGWHWDPYNYGQFSVRWTGNITIATSGTYVFQLASDDGSWLYIDSVLVLARPGLNSPNNSSLPTNLNQGVHQIEVDYYETCPGTMNTSGIDFFWMPPAATSFTIVPGTVLTPSPDFAMSASSTPLSVEMTRYNYSKISMTAFNGFAGTVVLEASSLPTGVTASLTPTSITGSSSSTLTIFANSNAILGQYSVGIGGTSGLLFHSIAISIRIVPRTGCCGAGGRLRT